LAYYQLTITFTHQNEVFSLLLTLFSIIQKSQNCYRINTYRYFHNRWHMWWTQHDN